MNILLVSFLMWPAPGPIDAFQANYASIKVDIQYRYRLSLVDPAAIADDRLWGSRDLEFPIEPEYTVLGRWALDGRTEYHSVRASDLTAGRPAQEPLNGAELRRVPDFEALYDGEVLAYRQTDGNVVEISTTNEPGILRLGKSPLFWWGLYPFPHSLRVQFPNAIPKRLQMIHAGKPTEVEVYTKPTQHGWFQVEIAYDPEIGYLPRFGRMIGFNSRNKTFVKELYVRDARLCKSGGFVPIDWFEAAYFINDFDSRYPDYRPEMKLVPSGTVTLGHFESVRFRDLVTPIGLDSPGNIRSIAAPGGAIRVSSPYTALSLDRLKTLAGRRLVDPSPRRFDQLDLEESRKYRSPSAAGAAWPYWLGSGVLALVAIVVLLWRPGRIKSRTNSLIGVLTLIGMLLGGCAREDPKPPYTRLTATFDKPTILYDPAQRTHSETLKLMNAGQIALRILKADGGCSCRRIDQSRFPFVLHPGQVLSLSVQLELQPTYSERALTFSFQTDQGTLEASPKLIALPIHQITPNSVSHGGLNDGEFWGFDLTQRTLVDHGAHETPGIRFQTTGAIRARKGSEVRRDLPGHPNLEIIETSYHIDVEEPRLGSFRAEVALLDHKNAPIQTVPIVWRRLPFLSTAPDRVTLGERPYRVFLRCPDEPVEFSRVLACPEGINAIVSSPRELSVRLNDHAPAIIDGVIEIETTARSQPPIRLPVVRFSSVKMQK